MGSDVHTLTLCYNAKTDVEKPHVKTFDVDAKTYLVAGETGAGCSTHKRTLAFVFAHPVTWFHTGCTL